MIPKVPDQVDIRNFLFNEESHEEVVQPEAAGKPEVKTEAKAEVTPEPEAVKGAESTEAEPEEKKELPFHKHPRFKRIVDENRKLQGEIEELKKMREQVPPAISAAEEKVPQEYANLFGEDVNAYRSWQKMLEKTANEQARALFDDMKKQEAAAKQAEESRNQKAVDYALNELSELAEETGIDLTDDKNTARNQVLDICAKYNLVTPEGFPNIRAAYELHGRLYPTQTPELEEKKKVLTKTVTKTNSQAKEDTVMTPKRLKEIEKRGGLSYLWGLNKS